MIKTYRDIPSIEFPVYRLPSSNVVLADGLLFLDGELIDDKNMPGKTLGHRRLQTPFHADLMRLRRGSYEVPYLLKYKNFIDNNGIVFEYMKTKKEALKCFKIARVEPKETQSLLWLVDVPFPLVIPRPPEEKFPYARILCLNGSPWLIYDYVHEKSRDTTRKI